MVCGGLVEVCRYLLNPGASAATKSSTISESNLTRPSIGTTTRFLRPCAPPEARPVQSLPHQPVLHVPRPPPARSPARSPESIVASCCRCGSALTSYVYAAALTLVTSRPTRVSPADLIRLGRQRLGRELTAKLAGVRFDLTASAEGENDHFAIRCQPARLIDALWQRFAEEIAGLIVCAKCPAPGCGRWFLRSTGRSDKAYCSGRCRMRKCRGGAGWDAR